MEEPSAPEDDFEMVDQSETHTTAKSETVDTQMEMNRNSDGEKEQKSSEGQKINRMVEKLNVEEQCDNVCKKAEGPGSKEENQTTKQKNHENITNVLSEKRFFVLLSGNTLNVHKAIIDHLTRQTSDLQEVSTVDNCDFILVFCPVVSRAGTDIEAAVQKLHSFPATKPAVLVVLHHTFDPECVVPNSSRAVHRENTITVDCLFHEDKGLQCHKNYESLTRITEMIQSQTKEVMEEPLAPKGDFQMVDQSGTHITAESKTVDTQMEINGNGDGEKEQKSSENITNVLSGKRFFVLLSGNTLNVHKAIIDHLTRQTSDLQEVSTVDDCDFILVFCPVVSRAGTDIEAAVQKLHSSSATKPAVLVVLHHTFDPECVVPNSSRAVHRENTITVDCLFHEDKGLLQCHKNYESLTRITELIQSQASSSWLGHYLPWLFGPGTAPKEKTKCENEEGTDKDQTESGSEEFVVICSGQPASAAEEKTKCENGERTDKDQTESGSEASVTMWCPFSSSATEEKNLCENEEGNEQGQTKSQSEGYVMICSCQPASAAEKKLCGHEKWKHKGLTYRKSGELRLMLLGNRSVQTAVKNIILGREDRNQAVTPTSTQQSENTQGEVAGRKVIVMDTPDWFSPGLCLEERLEKLENVDSLLHSPGPHAFLLVLHANQPTGEKKSFIEEMVETLGASCWQNTMIIFIVPDKYQGNNQSGDQEIQTILETSGKEVFCLNIKESGECSQVSDLLEKIEKMVNRRGEKIYSSDIYKHTLVQVRKLLKSIREKLEKCKDQIKRDSKDLIDEEKMRKLEQDLPEELQQKMEMKENEHIARTEEERNIMKIILPEIWKNILESNMKMHKKFSRQEEGQMTCKRPHEEEDKKFKRSKIQYKKNEATSHSI